MPEAVVSMGSHESRIIRSGDAARDPKELVLVYERKPKGRVLRPIGRLCGCRSAEKGPECTTPNDHDHRETEHEYRKRIASQRDVEVIVVCTPQENFHQYGAAGRMWPRGQTRTTVHRDELEELRQEHGRIEVLTVAELHSKVQVPIPADEDPVAFLEKELEKAKATKAKSAEPAPSETPAAAPSTVQASGQQMGKRK